MQQQNERRKMMKVVFEMEKATKNTIRFQEILEHELDAPKVGTIYIPKATLSAIGWKEGKKVSIEIEAE